MISHKIVNRKTLSGVAAAALLLASLTACASSSQGTQTSSREAESDTGRIKVCVTNGTGSAFELAWWDGYLDENNQPISARQVSVAADAVECVFSINGEKINRSEVNFYVWRNESLKSTIRLAYKYQMTDLWVVAPQMGTEDYMLFANGKERQIDWLRGTMFANYLKTTESYTSGSAYPVNIRIYSLW